MKILLYHTEKPKRFEIGHNAKGITRPAQLFVVFHITSDKNNESGEE